MGSAGYAKWVNFLVAAVALLISAGLPGDTVRWHTDAAGKELPTLWIIGDSTVRNGGGVGGGGQWGWGEPLKEMFDTSKIQVRNKAIGGRSSRTFLTEGRWDEILAEMKSGDYVLMQFGHNDPGTINDDSRARGTIRGVGEETEEIDNLLTKKHEVVHTYGWYMRKFVEDTKAHGATPIVLSYVPRCPRPTDTITPNPEMSSYRLWAKEVAEQGKADFIDLYGLIWPEYVGHTSDELHTKYFTPADYTHTSREGAELNAKKVAEGIKSLAGCSLKDFFLQPTEPRSR